MATLGQGAHPGLPVAAEAQTMDLWFEPDPVRLSQLAERGWLGQMGMTAMGLEAFHNTPGVDDVRDCLRKSLTLHHQRVGAQVRGEDLALARMWVISAGRARSALAAFEMSAAEGWPPGIYRTPEGIALWMVVVSELPRTRATLALRLMGRDEVLRDASAELAVLPTDAWERRLLLPVLVRRRFEIPANPADRDPEEEMFMATAQQLFETFEQQAIEKGVKHAIVRLFSRRLGRPLAETETKALGERLGRLGEDRLDAVVLDLSPVQLAAWLADPDAS